MELGHFFLADCKTPPDIVALYRLNVTYPVGVTKNGPFPVGTIVTYWTPEDYMFTKEESIYFNVKCIDVNKWNYTEVFLSVSPSKLSIFYISDSAWNPAYVRCKMFILGVDLAFKTNGNVFLSRADVVGEQSRK